MRPEHAVPYDFQWKWCEECNRRGQEAQKKNTRDLKPVGARLAPKAPVEGKVAVAEPSHDDSAPTPQFTAESTVAADQPHSSNVRIVSTPVRPPRTAQTIHA